MNEAGPRTGCHRPRALGPHTASTEATLEAKLEVDGSEGQESGEGVPGG